MLKKSLTTKDLLQISPNMKQKAQEYEPILIRQYRNRWVYRVGDYLVRIYIKKIPINVRNELSENKLKKQMNVNNRDVFVSCTCNFWKFNGPDYHAHDMGYSERIFSNLSSPDERDPNNEYPICKHVYAALDKFKQDFKSMP